MVCIEIKSNHDCCGCGACAAVCPQNCIVMKPNVEGFSYPEVNTDNCTECGLCTEICPWVNQPGISNRFSPPKVYAAWHLNDEIRRQSSSGGVFTAIADAIFQKGGVVVGAAFDEHMVCHHIIVEDGAGLSAVRGSKYVQSKITADLFKRIRSILNDGRFVLFTGTPCQVAGLRNFLGKDYENLLCADLICHGVPSPGWFQKYTNELAEGENKILAISLREKSSGWKRFNVKIRWSHGKSLIEDMLDNPYMVSFLKNYVLRESCYICKFTKTIRYGDLTIADYWKVATKYPEYDTEDKGTSLVLINCSKGQTWLNCCKDSLFLGKGDLDHAIEGNPMLTLPASRPKERDIFYKHAATLTVRQLSRKYKLHPQSFLQRALGLAKRRLKAVRGESGLKPNINA